MEEKLKPCPFCKNKLPRVISYGIESGIINQVHCDICGASGPDHADSKEKAINAWNKRDWTRTREEVIAKIDEYLKLPIEKQLEPRNLGFYDALRWVVDKEDK